MATVSEIPDIDSGVASPEVTPEGQIDSKTMSENKSEPGPESSNSQQNDKNSSESSNSLDLKSSKNAVVKTENNTLTVFSRDKAKDDISDDEDDDIYDESLAERLWGLTEMFPNSVRSATSSTTRNITNFIKASYQLSRQVVWIGVSSSVLLFAPVMFEIERYNVEEMVKQDRNRLVLGPGSAMSGPPGPPGLPPAPSR